MQRRIFHPREASIWRRGDDRGHHGGILYLVCHWIWRVFMSVDFGHILRLLPSNEDQSDEILTSRIAYYTAKWRDIHFPEFVGDMRNSRHPTWAETDRDIRAPKFGMQKGHRLRW